MAREDSVRGAVERIDKRTSDLAPVLDQISDSLKRIGKAFSPKEEGSAKKETRESLLAKFSPQENFNEKLVRETNENEIVLNQLKETLERNHKESFKVFQNMENYLKVISVEGLSGGGGGLLDIIGRDGKKLPPSSKPGAKPGAKPAGAGGFLKGAARFATRAVLPLAAGMAAVDAASGFVKSEEILGIKDREATLGEKLSSGAGSLASGLSFGLLDEKSTSKGIASFFGAGPDKGPMPSLEEQKKILKKDGSGFKTPEQLKAEGLDPFTGKPLPGTKLPAAPVAPKVEAKPPAAPVAPTVTPPAPPAAPVAPKVEAKPTLSTVEKKENPEVKKLQEEYFSLGKDLKKLNEDFTIPKEEKKKKRSEIVSKAAAITEKLEKIEPGSGDLGGLGAFEDREHFKATIEAHKQEDLKAEAMLASGDYEKNDEGAVVKKSSAKPTTPLMQKESITTTSTLKKSITSGETKTTEASAAQQKILELDDEYNRKTAEVKAKLVKEGRIEEGEILTEDMYQSIPELKALREEKATKRSELEKGVLLGTSQSITPSTSVSSQTVSNLTNENKDLMENLHNQAVQPVIITNNNTTSSNQQTVSPIRTSPRPTNNSFERKQSQVSSY